MGKKRRKNKVKNKIIRYETIEKKVFLDKFLGFKRVKGSYNALWNWKTLEDIKL